MELKLNGIDQALKIIPEYARGMIMDSIIQSKPLPAKDKDIQEYMIRFLVEVNDYARWQGIPGEPYRPRPYRSRAWLLFYSSLLLIADYHQINMTIIYHDRNVGQVKVT